MKRENAKPAKAKSTAAALTKELSETERPPTVAEADKNTAEDGRRISKGLLPLGLLLYILAQPSPKQPRVHPSPPQYGTCRYCGQVAPVQLMGFKAQIEADNYATGHCECADARRQTSLQTARGKIEQLFSDSAEAVREMLIENAELVQDEELQDVTVKLTSRIKCKVTKSSKGFLIITRTITDTQQETV